MHIVFNIEWNRPFVPGVHRYHHKYSVRAVNPITNVLNTAYSIFGTTQFVEAKNANYEGFVDSDLRFRAYTILQRQVYMIMRWSILRYALDNPLKINFLNARVFNLTPDNFVPSLEDIDSYLKCPRFLWRFSWQNYTECIEAMECKETDFKYLDFRLSYQDGSCINAFARGKHTKLTNSFKKRLHVDNINMSHYDLNKIDKMDKVYFNFQLTKFEKLEYLYSDDYMMFEMDGKTTYEEFTHLILTGQCHRYNSKILEEKVKFDNEKHQIKKRIIKAQSNKPLIEALKNTIRTFHSERGYYNKDPSDELSFFYESGKQYKIVMKLIKMIDNQDTMNRDLFEELFNQVDISIYNFYGSTDDDLSMLAKRTYFRVINKHKSKVIISNRLYSVSTWTHQALMSDAIHPFSFYKFLNTYVSAKCCADFDKLFNHIDDAYRFGWSFPKKNISYKEAFQFYAEHIPQKYLTECYSNRLNNKNWLLVIRSLQTESNIKFKIQNRVNTVRKCKVELIKDEEVDIEFEKIIGKAMQDVVKSIYSECFVRYKGDQKDPARVRVFTSKILKDTMKKLVSVTPSEVKINIGRFEGDSIVGRVTDIVPITNNRPTHGESERPADGVTIRKMEWLFKKFEGHLEQLVQRHIVAVPESRIPDKYKLEGFEQASNLSSASLPSTITFFVAMAIETPDKIEMLRIIRKCSCEVKSAYESITKRKFIEAPDNVKKEFSRYYNVILSCVFQGMKTDRYNKYHRISKTRFGKLVIATLNQAKNWNVEETPLLIEGQIKIDQVNTIHKDRRNANVIVAAPGNKVLSDIPLLLPPIDSTDKQILSDTPSQIVESSNHIWTSDLTVVNTSPPNVVPSTNNATSQINSPAILFDANAPSKNILVDSSSDGTLQVPNSQPPLVLSPALQSLLFPKYLDYFATFTYSNLHEVTSADSKRLCQVRDLKLFRMETLCEGRYTGVATSKVIKDNHGTNYFDLILHLCDYASARRYLHGKISLKDVKVMPVDRTQRYFIKQWDDRFRAQYPIASSAIVESWETFTYPREVYHTILHDRKRWPFDKDIRIIPFEWHIFRPSNATNENISTYLEFYDLKYGNGKCPCWRLYRSLVDKIQQESTIHAKFVHAWARDRHLRELCNAAIYSDLFNDAGYELGDHPEDLTWPSSGEYDLLNGKVFDFFFKKTMT